MHEDAGQFFQNSWEVKEICHTPSSSISTTQQAETDDSSCVHGSNGSIAYGLPVGIYPTLLFELRRSEIKFWSPLACDAMVVSNGQGYGQRSQSNQHTKRKYNGGVAWSCVCSFESAGVTKRRTIHKNQKARRSNRGGTTDEE